MNNSDKKAGDNSARLPPPRPRSGVQTAGRSAPPGRSLPVRGGPPSVESVPESEVVSKRAAEDELLDGDTIRRAPALGPPPAEASDVRAVESDSAASEMDPAVPAESMDDNADQSSETPEEDVKLEDDPYIGTTIGDRYVVDEIIGEGGMGRVYLAHHKVIGKRVAVKILHAELARDKEAVGRFVREAKAASSIGNPHIIDISDFGETEDGSTYFVMEYLHGQSLGQLMSERGTLPPETVCDVALQLTDGLAAAHRQDIIHRDLKPDNVTLIKQGKTDPFCKILDFGIAKVSTGTSSTKLTMAGAVFGTPHYMSPEQAAGAVIDHRTDIYSLGVMLYEMVSGRLPFNADNFMGILTQHMYKAPVPIRALVGGPDCPPGLEALILKCLSKKPDARYRTMEELADDIRKFQRDGVPDAVQEMMARSGSFNVPVDYFKGAPGALVVTPHGPRARLGPRIVALVGVLVAVAAVLFVIMRDSTTTAHPTRETTAAPRPSAPPSASAAPTAKTQRAVEVLVYATPPGAVAFVDGSEVQLPETFPVPDGETKSIEIRAAGHESQTIQLDGSLPKVGVELKRLTAGMRPQPKAGAKTAPKGKSKGGLDTVNPWDK